MIVLGSLLGVLIAGLTFLAVNNHLRFANANFWLKERGRENRELSNALKLRNDKLFELEKSLTQVRFSEATALHLLRHVRRNRVPVRYQNIQMLADYRPVHNFKIGDRVDCGGKKGVYKANDCDGRMIIRLDDGFEVPAVPEMIKKDEGGNAETDAVDEESEPACQQSQATRTPPVVGTGNSSATPIHAESCCGKSRCSKESCGV